MKTKPEVKVIHNDNPEGTQKILLGIPSTGKIRFEFYIAMRSLLYPSNWGVSYTHPIGFDVATSRNMIIEAALDRGDVEWVFFVDHDVLLPEKTPYILRAHMTSGKYPIISGLYYTKSSTPEPLIYRMGADGPYYDWEPGDLVWASVMGMGLCMIHMSVFKNMQPPWFVTPKMHANKNEGNPKDAVSVEKRESRSKWDDSSSCIVAGTEDFFFYERVIKEKVLQRAGWDVQYPETPFIVDTSLLAGHIALDTGKVYPNCMGDAHMVNHNAARERIERRKSKRW